MPEPHSDALVLFGATGDLAYKQNFPALYAMTRRGHLNMPVIGVAKSRWTIEQLRARARESIAAHGDMDPEAFRRFAELLHYAAGDYQDVATFDALRRTLGSAERPLFDLAIPPSLFAIVVSEVARSGCATDARVIVEKPFGRDLASAKALNATIHQSFPGDEMEPYERLLGDALSWDRTLFGSQAGVEAAWRVVDVVLKSDEPVFGYDCGTWGPAEAESLAADAGGWLEPSVGGRSREPETVSFR